MNSNAFFKLKNISKPKSVNGFSLDTELLEKEMTPLNGGIDLKRLSNAVLYQIAGDDELLRKYVPFFQTFGMADLKKMADKYPISKPCAMSVDSLDELAEHMAIGYQVAHFHYILAKKHYMKKERSNQKFPDGCCGMSSMNVAMSLMSLGYPNSSYAYTSDFDHGYVVLPFVLNNTNLKGSIIIDPTSDQLWKDRRERNAVFLRTGSKWEYRTEWRGGADLFPTRVFSIDVIKINHNLRFDEYDDYPFYASIGGYFFQRAFDNPVKLKEIQR